MTKHRFGLSATVLACVFGLSACGGGGSGSPQSAPPPASTMLGISASNYQAVGQATVSSALYLSGAGGTLTGAEVSDPRLLRRAVDVAQRALRGVGRSQPATLTGAELRETLPCAQGGSLLLTLNDANNNGNVDTGDTITVDAQACREDGTLTQGRMALSMRTLTGVFDSNNYSATLSMTLTAFSSTTGSDTVQGDGMLDLSMSQTPAGVTELALATTRLALSGRIAGQNYSTTLTDTRMTVRVETVNGAEKATISYSGGLTSSALGDKQVLITTPQPLVATGNDVYPSSGQLLVRGEGNSAVRITALNATQVRLELDAGGDGTYETQVLKTWAELR